MQLLFKNLILVLVLLTSTYTLSWTQRDPLPIDACKIHNSYGSLTSSRQLSMICRQGYLVGYDSKNKIPEFVLYSLQPQNALGCVARTNAFAADQSVKNGATPDDYSATGYDRGHMAPDGDLSWDQQVEYESFLMTNISPQAGSLNRGAWKLLETSVRGWAVQLKTSFTIYVGGIYNESDKQIGDGIRVPHAFFKIVINDSTREVAGWVFPHAAPYPNLGNDLTKFRSTIADIQKLSNIKFTLPKKYIELKAGSEWLVDFGNLTKAKREYCGKNQED